MTFAIFTQKYTLFSCKFYFMPGLNKYMKCIPTIEAMAPPPPPTLIAIYHVFSEGLQNSIIYDIRLVQRKILKLSRAPSSENKYILKYAY